jgi:hypothetical protein
VAARRIGGAGGGSDPGKRKSTAAGTIVTAAVVAGLVSAAGGATITESIGTGLDTAVQQSAETRAANAKNSAARGNDAEAWQRMAVREIKKVVTRQLRCAVQSYGQVQQFFTQTPCDSLNQALFALADGDGNVVAVSVIWVKMPDAEAMGRLKALEDTYGTGDITPFGTDALELAGVKFTAQHYKSRPDGKLLVVAETEPLHGHPSDALLNNLALVGSALPPLCGSGSVGLPAPVPCVPEI